MTTAWTFLSAALASTCAGGRVSTAFAYDEKYLTYDRDALRNVFVRAAHSIAIHNTDNHLRNIGLIRTGHAWKLAPCFDVNLNLNPALSEPRVTGVFGEVGAAEVDGLRALAPICGLSEREAARLVSRVLRALDGWKTEAMRLGCPRSEVELFAPVFADRCEGLVAAFR